ncbi:MAG: hypothetical protein O2975_03590, partial [Proteobacteria bacterium]|nr:hypothetical protein [Pseudomonadota bacterium]
MRGQSNSLRRTLSRSGVSPFGPRAAGRPFSVKLRFFGGPSAGALSHPAHPGDPRMSDAASYTVRDGIAVITLNNPP